MIIYVRRRPRHKTDLDSYRHWVGVEITQPTETGDGLKRGTVNVEVDIYQLADGSIFSGSQEDAIQANEGVMEKGTKI